MSNAKSYIIVDDRCHFATPKETTNINVMCVIQSVSHSYALLSNCTTERLVKDSKPSSHWLNKELNGVVANEYLKSTIKYAVTIVLVYIPYL